MNEWLFPEIPLSYESGGRSDSGIRFIFEHFFSFIDRLFEFDGSLRYLYRYILLPLIVKVDHLADIIRLEQVHFVDGFE